MQPKKKKNEVEVQLNAMKKFWLFFFLLFIYFTKTWKTARHRLYVCL